MLRSCAAHMRKSCFLASRPKSRTSLFMLMNAAHADSHRSCSQNRSKISSARNALSAQLQHVSQAIHPAHNSNTHHPKNKTMGSAAAGGITVRPATLADAPAITALGTAVFSATFRASGCTDAQLQAYLDEAYTPAAIRATLTDPSTHHTLVAVDATPKPTTTTATTTATTTDDADDDDNILGFALVNFTSTDPVIARGSGGGGYPRPCELQRLYVATAAHGRGVGTALMRAAEGTARGRGCATMWLGVWEGNTVAQGLYMGKLGFARVGEHVFDVGGDLQTDWILVKAL